MTSDLVVSPEVRRLIDASEQQAGGNLSAAVALLRDRLIFDPTFVAERAILIRWLAGNAMLDRTARWRGHEEGRILSIQVARDVRSQNR